MIKYASCSGELRPENEGREAESEDSGWGESEKLTGVLPNLLSAVVHRENSIFIATG